MKRCATAALVLALMGAPAFSEEKRQLGTHEHGHGTLDIAIEGQKVSMELNVPGSDIVGFEHAARTKKQKAALAAAKKKLEAGLNLFVPDPAAGCQLKKADVRWVLEEKESAAHSKGHGHSHGHNHKKKDTGHSHGHKHDEGDSHAEFKAHYELECAESEKLSKMDFPFFQSFKAAEKLTVQVLSAKGQEKHEVKRGDKPTITFTN
jgi:hypothetical protein